MSDFNQTVLLAILNRLASLGCGTFFAFLGYKLFLKGYFDKASELNAIWGKKRLVMKQVAPGVFFALLGAAIIWVTSQHPWQVNEQTKDERSLLSPQLARPLLPVSRQEDALQACNSNLNPPAARLLDHSTVTPDEAHQLVVCVMQAIDEERRRSTVNLRPDPSVIEKEAREHLRYARPGEVIYTLPVTGSQQTGID